MRYLMIVKATPESERGEFPPNALTVRGGEAELIAAARADLGVEQAD